jgi:hypothetical protein
MMGKLYLTLAHPLIPLPVFRYISFSIPSTLDDSAKLCKISLILIELNR